MITVFDCYVFAKMTTASYVILEGIDIGDPSNIAVASDDRSRIPLALENVILYENSTEKCGRSIFQCGFANSKIELSKMPYIQT